MPSVEPDVCALFCADEREIFIATAILEINPWTRVSLSTLPCLLLQRFSSNLPLTSTIVSRPSFDHQLSRPQAPWWTLQTVRRDQGTVKPWIRSRFINTNSYWTALSRPSRCHTLALSLATQDSLKGDLPTAHYPTVYDCSVRVHPLYHSIEVPASDVVKKSAKQSS